MSNRIFKSDLSAEGITGLIEQLKEYSEVSLPAICDQIVKALAEIGIEVAEAVITPEFQNCIEFKYIPLRSGDGNLTAWDGQVIHRVWFTKSGMLSGEADISPLLMSEYGAGKYAVEGHRGTFPGQRNAWRSQWFWYDEDGTKHSSEEDITILPTRPMYTAMVEMMNKAEWVVREVFSQYGY